MSSEKQKKNKKSLLFCGGIDFKNRVDRTKFNEPSDQGDVGNICPDAIITGEGIIDIMGG